MKRFIIVAIILMWFGVTIKGVHYCGLTEGWYIDVDTRVYDLYYPVEVITNNYIQVDSNY